MKNNGVVFVTILVAIITLSCSREKEIISEEVGRKLTITAYREDSEIETKTTRDVNGVVSWSAHEDISLFYSAGTNGGSKFTSTNEAPATVADFSGTINVITGVVEGDTERYFYGIYPYNEENSVNADGSIVTVIPDIQTAAEGTFADNHFVSMGRSRGLEMGFYNLCGGFKFKLLHEGVTKVTLRGNSGEELAGKVKVSLQDGYPIVTEVLDPKTELVMTCPDGGAFKTGVEYFFVMRPITFENGFTFTMETEDSAIGTRTVDVQIDVERSYFSYSSSAIDSGVNYFVRPLAVDLGLSVKWASLNLGAKKAEDPGYYYSWGELEPKEAYSSANYTFNESNYDECVTLHPEDDAASVTLGGLWRMPTISEVQELADSDNCIWEWGVRNGVKGYTIVSRKNGNEIFLPATGAYEGTAHNFTESGCYWTSSFKSQGSPLALDLYFNATAYLKDVDGAQRFHGLVIRPVYDETVTDKTFPVGNEFDEDAYITYVANHQEWLNMSTDVSYTYDTQFSAGSVPGTRIEMKFQIPEHSSGKAILSYGSEKGLAIDASNVYYYANRRYHEDGDTWYEREFTQGTGGGIAGTGTVVLTASCEGNQIAVTVNGEGTTIPVSVSSLNFQYVFSDYDQESGDGIKYEYLAGVLEGTKLYYVKIWNGDDLVYFGHASRAVCSYSSEEEYCWYDEVGKTYTFARSLYTLTDSEITPYNPSSPIVTVRQPFGGGMD